MNETDTRTSKPNKGKNPNKLSIFESRKKKGKFSTEGRKLWSTKNWSNFCVQEIIKRNFWIKELLLYFFCVLIILLIFWLKLFGNESMKTPWKPSLTVFLAYVFLTRVCCGHFPFYKSFSLFSCNIKVPSTPWIFLWEQRLAYLHCFMR